MARDAAPLRGRLPQIGSHILCLDLIRHPLTRLPRYPSENRPNTAADWTTARSNRPLLASGSEDSVALGGERPSFENLAGDLMKCPVCSISLVPEVYEGVTIDRCPSCRGTWLDAGELTHIVETQQVAIPEEIVRETLALASAEVSSSELRLVACPKCDGLMNPVNYDHSSGVIIDHCPLGHGNWLDASELERVQAHHEYWANQSNKLEGDWTAFLRAVLARREPVAGEARMRGLRPTRYLIHRMLGALPTA